MILEYIILLDVASICIMLLLIASIVIKKLYTLRSSKIFIALIILSIVTCIFDILSVRFFDEPFPVLEVFKYIGFIFNSAYYICRTTSIVFYTVYILELTDSLKNVLKKPLLFILIFSPILVCYSFEIINIFNHMVFDVGIQNGRYYFTTGNIYSILLYVIPSLYFILCSYVTIKYRYYFNKAQIISIFSIIPLSIISFIFQFVSKTTDFPKNSVILVELFATTLGMVLITSTIESASELVDTNTGLISFKRFNKVISRKLTAKANFSIILVEISNFYKIQNKLNYTAAKEYVKDISLVLKKMAKQLSANAYSIDDGLFAIAMDSSDVPFYSAISINEALKKVYRKEFVPETKTCIICLPDDINDRDSLVKFVRNFHTKFNFNNQIVYYRELKNDKSFIINNNIDIILNEAFKNNEFEVYYQPIYDIKNKSFTSCEALIRLNSKEFGFIEPIYFINYAEISGKIYDIDSFVVEEVIKFVASQDFYDTGMEFVNINISIANCLNLNLYNKVVELIKKYEISPSQLHFELVEGNDLVNHEKIHETINEFKKIGILFSLDNYGTGYSNIDHFTKAPIDTVKLDKALVDNSKNQGMDYVLANTINLIKSLGRKIVVEGIETKDNLDDFLKYDCDYIQGYYYSRPICKNELLEFIKRNKGVK